MCQEVIDGQLRLSAWMSRVEQKLNHALESLMPGSPGTEMAACKRHSLNTINSRHGLKPECGTLGPKERVLSSPCQALVFLPHPVSAGFQRDRDDLGREDHEGEA